MSGVVWSVCANMDKPAIKKTVQIQQLQPLQRTLQLQIQQLQQLQQIHQLQQIQQLQRIQQIQEIQRLSVWGIQSQSLKSPALYTVGYFQLAREVRMIYLAMRPTEMHKQASLASGAGSTSAPCDIYCRKWQDRSKWHLICVPYGLTWTQLQERHLSC